MANSIDNDGSKPKRGSWGEVVAAFLEFPDEGFLIGMVLLVVIVLIGILNAAFNAWTSSSSSKPMG